VTLRAWPLTVLILVQAFTLGAFGAQPDQFTVEPQFGYDNIVATEHWTPMRFILTAPDEPLSGTLTLQYMQDGSQYATTTTRFSLTPGVPTPVDVGVCMARFNKGVGLTITTDSGRRLVREFLDFENPQRMRKVVFTPPMLVSGRITILSVGLEGLADAGDEWSRGLYIASNNQEFTRNESGDLTIENRLRVSAMSPDKLFSFWSAYDGVSVVVVRASAITEMPERARRAMLEWQRGGGEIIIFVDDASILWRRWLPDGPAGEVIHLDEPRQVTTPGNFDEFPVHSAKSDIGNPDLAKPALSMNARVITLTPLGASQGWELVYELDEGPIAGFAARGPVGLGFVTIAGFDPGRATAVRSKKAASIAWGAVLERLVRGDDLKDSQRFPYYASSSGATQGESAAIDLLVDATIKGEGISLKVLFVVLAVLAAFVLAIGPVDAIVLRRLGLRHWSWLTALGWIALASVLAVQIPNRTMGGDTHIGRAVVTDAVLGSDGSVIASWSTGLTTSYAGRTGVVGPRDTRPGSWWRGVSPLEVWQWGGSKPAGALSTLRLSQRPEIAQGGARVTTSPAKLTQGGWTARALLDVTPAPPPVYARVVTDGQSKWLELAPGLRSITIDQVKVTIRSEAWEFDDLEPNAVAELKPEAARVVERVSADDQVNWMYRAQQYVVNETFGELPSAHARMAAMEQWASGDSKAMIEIRYHTDQLPFETVGADTTEEQGLVRIVVSIVVQQPESAP
jgi:hypothetical protein